VSERKVLYSEEQLSQRVKELGEEISRDFKGKTLDVICLVDSGHVFMADLIRSLAVPVRTHFMSMAIRNVMDPNYDRERQEIFFYPEIDTEGRSLLVVDGVLQTGITLDFLLRRLWMRKPREVKMAILLNKEAERRVLLEPEYVGFQLDSNDIVVGYGLAWQDLDGNLPYLSVIPRSGPGGEPPPEKAASEGDGSKPAKKKKKKKK
jgi:hypoxanthine phosphoribosyltransferase